MKIDLALPEGVPHPYPGLEVDTGGKPGREYAFTSHRPILRMTLFCLRRVADCLLNMS